MVVKEEIERFCQTTSVKGIPRAAKADHKGLRVTWVVAVIMMISLATYQVTSLVTDYLQYPSYTVTNEKVFHPHDNKPVLPTVTVCNENPFSSLKPPVSVYGLPTLSQYYSLIDQLTQCHGCNTQQLYRMTLMQKLMKTTNAYFQNIGPKYSSLVGHDQHNFIVSCKEMILLGMTFLERECDKGLTNITVSPDPDYFSCYRITLPNDYQMDEWGMIVGVSLVLYLDNTSNQTIDTPITGFGAIAVPTHQHGSAFPLLDGIELPAGISAKVQMSMERQYRLEPPWGHCHPSTVEGYEAMKMCISDCFQQHIQQNCNCTDSRMVKHMETNDKPFCLKAEAANPTKPAGNYVCATEYLKVDTVVECLDRCPLTCQEFGYRNEMSFSRWPSAASMTSFYNQYISGRDFEEYFTVIKHYINGNCTSENDCMVKYLTAQNLLQDNFLQVKLHLSDVRYYSTQEKPKIGIADFCSKLGGILNLWAGITVVLVLELLELGCRIVFFYWRNKREKTTVEACTITQDNKVVKGTVESTDNGGGSDKFKLFDKVDPAKY